MARGQRVGARAFHSESPEPVGSSGPDFSAGRGSGMSIAKILSRRLLVIAFVPLWLMLTHGSRGF
jgi:hypothetical protein